MVTYECVKSVFEASGCQLLTTQEEMEINNLHSTSKYRIISTCGHERICWFHMFKSRGTGLICQDCINKKASIIGLQKEPISYLEIEHYGVKLLQKYIGDKICSQTTHESCSANIAIKLKESLEDKWLPIKVKTTKCMRHSIYSFGNRVRGIDTNIWCIMVSLQEEKFWIIPGCQIANQSKISIGLKKSKYSQYEIDKNNIEDKLLELLRDDSNLKKLEVIQEPNTVRCKIEQDFRKLREDKLNKIQFDYPEINRLSYDFCINKHRIQEKTAAERSGKKHYHVSLARKRNGQNNQPYHLIDADFYWINMPDKNTFYIFPANVLAQHSIISNGEQIGKKSLSFSKNNDWQKWCYKYDDPEINDKISNIFFNV